MSKVYVIQDDPNKNILPAQRFGEIVTLLPVGKNIMFSPGPVVSELTRKLARFCSEDYLLCIGDPAAIAIATAVASRWSNGRVSLLKWDRMEKDYYPIKFDIYQH